MSVAGSKEYLIDALALHDHMHLLQDSLEDASIVKVGHLYLVSTICTLKGFRKASALILNAILLRAGAAWRRE